jgi:hypothetical protein
VKKCPKCGQIFDPDLDFCLEDGTRLKALLADSADIPTADIQAPRTIQMPRGQIDTIPTANAARPTNGVGAWVYAVIGVLAIGLLLAIGIIAFLWTRGPAATANSVSNSNTSSAANNSNGAALGAATPTPRPTASTTPEPSAQLSGSWTGDWNGQGAYYTARVELRESGGKVDGQIFWTYVRTSNAQQQNKLGKTATEFVRGSFNSSTGSLDISGYRKDDPDVIIVLDHYQMKLSSDGRSLSGRSKHGTIQLHK